MHLSIIIPTYNRSELLGVTIKKLLKQFDIFKEFEFEIIVSDNASLKSPSYIINDINDKRIKYFENEVNLGMSKNILNSLNFAKGKYLWLFGDDDFIDDKAIDYVVSRLINKNDFDFLQISKVSFIDENEINWSNTNDHLEVILLDLNKNMKEIDSFFGFISNHVTLKEKFITSVNKVSSRDTKILNNNYLFKLINYEVYKISNIKLKISNQLVYQRITSGSSFYRTPELIFKTFFKDVNEIVEYQKKYNPEFLRARRFYFKSKIDILIIKLFHSLSFNRILKIYRYTNYSNFYVLFILLMPKKILREMYFFYKKYKGTKLPNGFELYENNA